MREIEFRGQRVDNGEFVYGDRMQYDRCWQGNDFTKEPVVCIGTLDGHEEVIPETVGQYTGLKDKNGKKVFDGDKIRLGGRCDPIDLIVLWDNESLSWRTQRNGDDYDNLCCLPDFKVIGTIHDKEHKT